MEMLNRNRKEIIYYFVIGLLLGFVVLMYTFKAEASAVEKITWCHVTPSGNQETLELPLAALENAGHVNAQGNPLHAGDHAGACVEPTPEDECDNEEECKECEPTPTDEPEVTPTVEPTVEVTPEPDLTPSVVKTESAHLSDGLSDGRSDGRSDGSCSQKPCIDNRSGQPLQPVPLGK